MTSEQLWKGLNEDVYLRLCECRNTRADILPLAVCVSINKDITAEKALEYVLEHLSCNNQLFNLNSAELKALEWAIESKARLPKAKKSKTNNLVADMDEILSDLGKIIKQSQSGIIEEPGLAKRLGDIGNRICCVRNEIAEDNRI